MITHEVSKGLLTEGFLKALEEWGEMAAQDPGLWCERVKALSSRAAKFKCPQQGHLDS